MTASETNGFTSVCVIGLGYVGLPTAAVLASRDLDVLGVDIDANTVALVNDGKVPIVEPELDTLVNGAVAKGRLRAATEPAPADAFIIAVPTPFADGHKPDLSYVEAATRALAPHLAAGNLVIVESTVPVGTTEAVSGWLAEARPDLTFPHAAGEAADVSVAHSPERVLPGRVLLELVGNDRVIGGVTAKCAERTALLYAIAVQGDLHRTTARTAELVKLAENAYRDVNIAFANELSLVCDKLGVDVWDAVALANRHPRVEVLKPGPGVGGHCIAVDPWFIVDSAPNETPLIQAARTINDSKPAHVARQVVAALADPASATVACLGLAYKADIDDLRQSPSVDVVRELAVAGVGNLLVVEPHTAALPAALSGLDAVSLVELDSALDAAEAVVLLTDHQPFRQLASERLAGKSVFDTRGAWRPMT